MIKTQKMSPSVYYNQSRDFQLFGRLYDVIFNYVKTNVNGVVDITNNINPNQKILELMCNTLGFKTTHMYDNEQLSALCSIFLTCMKSKGTAKSVLLLLKMICYIEGSSDEPQIIYGYDADNLIITLPADVSDLTLTRDVLSYIMPAGTSYSLITQTIKGVSAATNFMIETDVNKTSHDLVWSPVNSSIVKVVDGDQTNGIINRDIIYDPTKEDASEYNVGDNNLDYINSVNSNIISLVNSNKTKEVENISINVNKAKTEESNNENS